MVVGYGRHSGQALAVDGVVTLLAPAAADRAGEAPAPGQLWAARVVGVGGGRGVDLVAELVRSLGPAPDLVK